MVLEVVWPQTAIHRQAGGKLWIKILTSCTLSSRPTPFSFSACSSILTCWWARWDHSDYFIFVECIPCSPSATGDFCIGGKSHCNLPPHHVPHLWAQTSEISCSNSSWLIGTKRWGSSEKIKMNTKCREFGVLMERQSGHGWAGTRCWKGRGGGSQWCRAGDTNRITV